MRAGSQSMHIIIQMSPYKRLSSAHEGHTPLVEYLDMSVILRYFPRAVAELTVFKRGVWQHPPDASAFRTTFGGQWCRLIVFPHSSICSTPATVHQTIAFPHLSEVTVRTRYVVHTIHVNWETFVVALNLLHRGGYLDRK